MTVARAMAIYLEADRKLAFTALDNDSRKYYEAVKQSAISVLFFG